MRTLLFCKIMWAAAFVLIVIGFIILKYNDIKAIRCTKEIQAVVLYNDAKMDTVRGSNGKRTSTVVTYRPVYRYEYNGNVYTKKSKFKSVKILFQKGESVTLKIDPDDPDKFYCPSERAFVSMGQTLIVVGGFSVVFPIFMYWFIRKLSGSSWEAKKEDGSDHTKLPEYTGE